MLKSAHEDTEIVRVWAMPNKWTFKIKPIKRLLRAEVMHDGLWLDPFAGKNSPAHIRNDINPKSNAQFHGDALDFVRGQPSNRYDGVLFDPPYSIYESKRHYSNDGSTTFDNTYLVKVKDEISRVVKIGGKVLCFGWSSTGLGRKRGFKFERMLVVYHGGLHNDTIVTVEKKIK